MNSTQTSATRRPRIAWCSSTVFPEVYGHLGIKPVVNCPWKSMLLAAATATMDADWLVIAPGRKELECDFTRDGVRYVVLGHGRRLHNWSYDWRGYEQAGKVLASWEPDIMHVHGSENYFGLLTARGVVQAQGLIALQGLLNPYCAAVWGPFGLGRVFSMERIMELLRGTGLLGLACQWRKGANLEREVLRGNAWFGGRTEWDCAHLLAMNPHANYRPLHELLRPEFAQTKWSLAEAERHTVFFTNLSGPHKGGDTLVEAIRILKQTIPDVRLRIGGSMAENSGYGRHLLRAIARARVAGHVEFVGYLDATRIAAELKRAHVFASASFIDNSPNSVGEAMTVGVPSVCTFVGGLPSLGAHNREIVFCPVGDPAALAHAIRKIFEDDAFAERISAAAREKAGAFHDPVATTEQLRAIYGEMLQARHGPRAETEPRQTAARVASASVAAVKS